MTQARPSNFENLWSPDRKLQNEAFFTFLPLTEGYVAWAYDVWEDVVANLAHKDNHNRAIAAQILCNLARSDRDNRILDDFAALLAVTRDERFVTARHCLQALWKVGMAGPAQRALLLDGLKTRFEACIAEKNCTLIRYDIIQGLRRLYDETGEEDVKAAALAWIATETDLKYHKKYATLWRGASKRYS